MITRLDTVRGVAARVPRYTRAHSIPIASGYTTVAMDVLCFRLMENIREVQAMVVIDLISTEKLSSTMLCC